MVSTLPSAVSEATVSAAVAALVGTEGEHGWKAVLKGGVLRITIANPPVNAVNKSMWSRLLACMQAVHEDEDVRAVLLVSDNERVFCAGADFKEVGQDDGGKYNLPGDRRRVARQANTAWYEAPVPTVVALRGVAAGAGAVLAALADLVVGGTGTRISLPEIDRGVVGGSRYMARMLPEVLMRKMMLLGCTVEGDELHRVGAFAEYVADDRIVDVAQHLAEQLASKHPVVMRQMKQSMVEVEDMSVTSSYRIEQKYAVMIPASVRAELVGHPTASPR